MKKSKVSKTEKYKKAEGNKLKGEKLGQIKSKKFMF